MSYALKKLDTHNIWTLYELQPMNNNELLKTSSTEADEHYQRLNKTRKESRKNADVSVKKVVKAISEKTTGDLSF